MLRSKFGVLAYGCITFRNCVSELLESQETPDSVSLRRALMGVRQSPFVDFSAALAILWNPIAVMRGAGHFLSLVCSYAPS